MFFLCISSFAQTVCTAGFAGAYPCNKIDLQSNLTNSQLGGVIGSEGNDIWGWTDPLTNKEYAIMGLTTHTAFVDISNPTSPIYLGKLKSSSVSQPNNIWRDIKVYNNHAYIVSEAIGHGLQVFDLTNLRGISSPQIFNSKFHYTGFGKCHNIAIDEVNGYAYAIGTRTYDASTVGVSNGGGPHIMNIQDSSIMPVFINEYNMQGYSHDAQIVVYNGPDTEHLGKEIYIGSNETKVVIVDITNKVNPTLLSTFNYSNRGYTHQGWLTENHKYFLLGDELDEQNIGFNTKTLIIDLTDLDVPVLKWDYRGVTKAIDHNGYIKGNEFYLANYRAGLRIMDISNLDNANMNEIAFFDTFPTSDSNIFNGAWSVYPYFASGNIIISDIERGLFVVKKNAVLSNSSFDKTVISLFPNPAKNKFLITSKIDINKIEIFNVLGSKLKTIESLQTKEVEVNINGFLKGVYLVLINGNISEKLIIQ